MDKRKPNISRWYVLGIAALLMTACLLLGVGTTLARYRTDSQAGILFEPREPVSVTLGRMKMNTETEALEFDSTATIGWETQADGSALMNFVISNQAQQDEPLEVRVRLLGSLHAWNGEESTTVGESETTTETTEPVTPGGTVVLTDCTPLEDDGERETTEDGTEQEAQYPSYAAYVMRIPENSALYHSFGDGWVFRFLDDEGQELTWTLEEGKLSCVELNITINGDVLAGTSLFQLQIVAEQTD